LTNIPFTFDQSGIKTGRLRRCWKSAGITSSYPWRKGTRRGHRTSGTTRRYSVAFIKRGSRLD